ncbi:MULTISPECIES: 4-hydroxy-3-methylbut-2-enyl diphosphate reductase [Gordonibacter]|uniref:4-hydroxy-3-methylbut-2-enyl diphosphate reductase n=1 Tax=Gordonibacter faecis TaxID=3047475 RepID=A0ABT7DQM8_9ACTN|nr:MULTISPECIES: 4-hydroxy-3-methylbut-2-enyl diphosphate reductase [unclassified Gordonibacter]MDJ1651712.1 4-hydroxy-3-methylbut-2-enyl diphosphate reductase [Gordonibacter sp. KGMB12511]HIW75301.1 4-hydroxy-3-methylbut-2-enyl diphosphate reductase [Candidatus Gordonibacter avicola]
MKVVLAEHAGACYGVQRALDMAVAAAGEGEGASTLGPLIHNPQVVAELEARGVRAVEGPDDVERGAVIIRSHGVTPAVRRAVVARDLPLIDATCPHVARAQKAAAELARRCGRVVVVGEEGHPEVEGLVAHAREAGGEVVVVASPADLPAHLEAPVGIVVQTTQTREALDAIVAELEARGIQPEVKNTICFATRQRQEAAAALADKVDAIVVIGGRNSSNTTRLADICAAACPRTHHIESPEEIDPTWFAGCFTVGVTAGASTPEVQISAVVARLEALEG